MLGWKAETDQELSAEDFLNLVSDMHKCTCSIAIEETVVKLHTRWYYTPDKLHRMYPLVPNTCFRGCCDKGTLLITFWSVELYSPYGNRPLQRCFKSIALTYQMCIVYAELPDVPPLAKN